MFEVLLYTYFQETNSCEPQKSTLQVMERALAGSRHELNGSEWRPWRPNEDLLRDESLHAIHLLQLLDMCVAEDVWHWLCQQILRHVDV